MCKLLRAIWRQEDGVLSFEWVLLVTLLVIGVVAGLAAARDAIIDELGDVAQAMLALDGSYTISWPLNLAFSDDPMQLPVEIGQASDSGFLDFQRFTDCGRTQLVGQTPQFVLDGGP